jgi:hypothetical protein
MAVIHDFVEDWIEMRSKLQRQLKLIESGKMGTGTDVVGSTTEATNTTESFSSLSQCAARLKSLTKPFLNWAGKAERQQISVPTLPLFVHERHSTQAIIETLTAHKAARTNLDLFGDAGLDIAEKLDAYQPIASFSVTRFR